MIDLSVVAARLEGALRSRGVQAGTRRALMFAEALVVLAPSAREELYWVARTSMLPSIDDAVLFDTAFGLVFGDATPHAINSLDHIAAVAGLPADQAAHPIAREERQSPQLGEQSAAGDDSANVPVLWLTASLAERLNERDFDAFSEDERALMLRLINFVRVPRETRRSRRRRRDLHGDRFDLGATLRGTARTGGELVHRRTTRRRELLRPLVFILDVSGSMVPFARALLQYARVAARTRSGVRAFAFATRLTDLTQLLRLASDDDFAAALGSAIRDYAGGTNIGGNLRAFNDRYAQGGIARGGTVIILSDGWERGDPAMLASEVVRLRRLSHRIVWVNPHKRHPAYEPLVAGMAAALPYVDVFVSGHNVRTLDAVADIVGQAAAANVRVMARN